MKKQFSILVLGVFCFATASFADVETPACDHQFFQSLAGIKPSEAGLLQSLANDIRGYDIAGTQPPDVQEQAQHDAWQMVLMDYSTLAQAEPAIASAINAACDLDMTN
jgi:hypothetical protein